MGQSITTSIEPNGHVSMDLDLSTVLAWNTGLVLIEGLVLDVGRALNRYLSGLAFILTGLAMSASLATNDHVLIISIENVSTCYSSAIASVLTGLNLSTDHCKRKY